MKNSHFKWNNSDADFYYLCGMEPYIVSARKYRPSTFGSVVGQGALAKTLKNAIATERLAHAYLFCGSRGVGKTSIARIFAKTINCTNRTADGEACNECDSCRAFNEGNSLNIVELDAASNNGVEAIRELIDQVYIPPVGGGSRVFIIDEVHMLSTAAFNAFLKTLEEPPAYVIFILATTEKQKIIPTILSRCQIYDFNRITVQDMVRHLEYVAKSEGIEAEPAALSVIARQADGAMRDALTIFDQVAACSQGHITYESATSSLNVLDGAYYGRVVDAALKGDVPAALLVFHEVRRKGFDPQFFINGFGEYLRDLMLASAGATAGLIDVPDDVREELIARARDIRPEWLYAAIGLCSDADLNYRTASNKQLLIELTLIRIAQLLTPSPAKSGLDEGAPLKPLVAREPSQATAAASQPAPAPSATTAASAPASPATAQPQASVPPPAPRTAPARVQSPAPSAPAPAARATTAAGQPTLRVGSLSLNTRSQAPAAEPDKPRDRPFKPENVAAAWAEYITHHADERILVSTMQAAVPQPLPSGHYGVKLPTPVQARLIEEAHGDIIAFMRGRLANDSFELDIDHDDAGRLPQYWNEREVFQHIGEHYPAFVNFVAELGLTLM